MHSTNATMIRRMARMFGLQVFIASLALLAGGAANSVEGQFCLLCRDQFVYPASFVHYFDSGGDAYRVCYDLLAEDDSDIECHNNPRPDPCLSHHSPCTLEEAEELKEYLVEWLDLSDVHVAARQVKNLVHFGYAFLGSDGHSLVFRTCSGEEAATWQLPETLREALVAS